MNLFRLRSLIFSSILLGTVNGPETFLYVTCYIIPETLELYSFVVRLIPSSIGPQSTISFSPPVTSDEDSDDYRSSTQPSLILGKGNLYKQTVLNPLLNFVHLPGIPS